MKQWLLFPRQKVGLVWVSAIFRTQILLHSFLLFTFLLSPIAGGAVDITQQLHRPTKELQNLREELKSFESYAQLYKQQGNYLTARNFYERAIILARTLEDSKQEMQLLDQLTKMLQLK